MVGIIKSIVWIWFVLGMAAAGLMQIAHFSGQLVWLAESASVLAEPWGMVFAAAGLLPDEPALRFLAGVGINSGLLLGIADMMEK